MAGYEKLEEIIKDTSEDPDSCVFLHPIEKRGYTVEELNALTSRDFESRLFITGTQCAGDSAFLRTHHTDNARHASNFNYVRDYLKAFHVTKNWTCAKTVLTTLLTLCFQLNSSGYYTFASSIASGLSRNGGNTEFEGTQLTTEYGKKVSRSLTMKVGAQSLAADNLDDIYLIRTKFCFIMDVIFKRMAIKKFLIDDDKNNIFRLVHCETKHSKKKSPLIIPLFSFILQLTLTGYVVREALNGPPDNWTKPTLWPLATITFFYCFMIATYNITETIEAYQIFGQIGALQMMDVIVNIIVPLVLTVSGFVVILREESYIGAVLNSTALFFIAEIDDQLPLILGHPVEAIVKNFLIAESITHFDTLARCGNEYFKPSEIRKQSVKCGVQFSDYFITNLPEQGITNDTPFQPYQVMYDDSDLGHVIYPSSFVTVDCLLKKIEWKYTTGYPTTTNPRVGYLRLTKINDEVVDIERKEDPFNLVGLSNVTNALEGLFIITTFQMSEDVIKLRVCGSYTPLDFLQAFESYSLWDINSEARKKILSLRSASSNGRVRVP